VKLTLILDEKRDRLIGGKKRKLWGGGGERGGGGRKNPKSISNNDEIHRRKKRGSMRFGGIKERQNTATLKNAGDCPGWGYVTG